MLIVYKFIFPSVWKAPWLPSRKLRAPYRAFCPFSSFQQQYWALSITSRGINLFPIRARRMESFYLFLWRRALLAQNQRYIILHSTLSRNYISEQSARANFSCGVISHNCCAGRWPNCTSERVKWTVRPQRARSFMDCPRDVNASLGAYFSRDLQLSIFSFFIARYWIK